MNRVTRMMPGGRADCISALFYTVLYYTILYYTLLCYTILYYTVLFYSTLFYSILYYTILYYTILYYTILYYTSAACIARTRLRPLITSQQLAVRILEGRVEIKKCGYYIILYCNILYHIVL